MPYTRGEEVSRPFEDVLTEVADLADQGVREVTLLGQNVNAYRGPLPASDDVADFALLLETIAEFDGIERIRYTTSHPKEMSAAADRRLRRSSPKLVSHLHLPVQSGSDRVLAAMKRGYTALEYKSIVRRLRAARPDLSLTTDFIVGFPGETEADFAQTMQLARRRRLRRRLQLRLQPAPGHARRRFRRPGARRANSRRGSRACRRCSTRSTARYSEAMVGTPPARARHRTARSRIRASSPPAPPTTAS